MAIADIPVILNPAARSAQAGSRMAQVSALSPRVRLCPTQGPGDARRLARELACGGASIVVAAGGDGTINEVVNGLAEAGDAGHRCHLGLLPTGTMNVFAMELGLPVKDLAACWRVIERQRTKTIDLWKMGEHRFVQLAGAGLDAAVISATTWRRKKRLGPLAYVLSGLQVLSHQSPTLTVKAPGRAPITGSLVLLGNGAHYGGPFCLFPQAQLDDGKIDVLVFHRGGYRQIFNFFKAAIIGAKDGGWSMTAFQTTELEIDGPENVLTEADGEVSGRAPTTVSREDWSLSVCV